VREFFDGTLVLGGAISSGRAIRAAQILGADLAYSGTRFIATNESLAHDQYREMLVNSNVQDLMVTKAFTGANANMLIPSIKSKGLDPENLKPKTDIDFNDPQGNMKAWKDIWSAGQGVGAIKKIQPVAQVVKDLRNEYVQVVAEEATGDQWTHAKR
jgi:nitronate monooxygenase